MFGSNRRSSRASDASQADTPTSKIPRKSTPGGSTAPSTPLQEGAERVKVVVRVRPPHPHETPGGITLDEDGQTIVLHRKNASVAQTDFKFDKVLGPEAKQVEVYDAAVKPIVDDVLKGYNGTIMAYGQTGAGKTYTLSSVQSAENIGMMPRAAASLFSEIAADSGHVYNVLMGYVQIYQELIQDLLRPESENLQIREGSSGVFVAGVEEKPVRSVEDCLRLMQLGDQNRRVAFTQLNATSSRSHAIIMITVIKRRRTPGVTTPERQRMKVGKLFIVDLAGSERLKKSQSTGQRANEAKAINLSLTTLGICINARADPNSRHVPFRDSKLTRLLQESLGGNAKTSLVVAVAHAEEHADESLQALQFGARAMRVVTRAVVNENTAASLLSAELLASLGNLEIQPCLVDASLLAKEEELGRIQEALQAEKDSAAKIIAALRAEQDTKQADRERELSAARAEAEAIRLRAEEQAAQQQKTQAEVATLAAQHQQEIRSVEAQLRAAETALQEERGRGTAAVREAEKEAATAKQQHAKDLEEAKASAAEKVADLQRKHEVEVESLRSKQRQELQERRQEHEQQLQGVQKTLAAAQQELGTAKAAAARHAEDLVLQKKALQDEWQARLLDLEQAGERQLAEERAETRRWRDALQEQREQAAAAAADASAQLEALQRRHATLEDDHSALLASAAALKAEVSGLKAELAAARQQLAAQERSGEEYRALWLNNKRLGDAARTIQRCYKAWRLRRLHDHSSKTARELAAAARDRSTLEGQNAVMQRDQHLHLVWSGQALVASSLLTLEEAVQQIRAAFLLPSKELKTLGHVKSRMSMSPGMSGSPMPGSPAMLARSGSLMSEASIGSFINRGSSAVKTPPPPPGRAMGGGITAHWGSPAV